MDGTPTNSVRFIALVSLAALTMVGLATGCSLMRRSSDSGYGGEGPARADESSRSTERDFAEREDAAGELGLGRSQELTGSQRRAVEQRMELKRLERSALDSRQEREQYYKAKALLRSDSERLDFLKVGSFEGRERWLRSQGINLASPKFAPDVQDLIQQNDIAVGMSKHAVRESWGEPEAVDVAGNPIYGNERWRYVEQVASSEGYQTEGRMIYFEGGRVVGWEKF